MDNYPADDKIIIENDIVWNETENQELFFDDNVKYDYRPYFIAFEPPKYPKMISIKRIIHLNAFSEKLQILDATLKVVYHIIVDENANLEGQLMWASEDAHIRFLAVIDLYNKPLHILSKFEDSFHPWEALEHIQSLLRNGYGH